MSEENNNLALLESKTNELERLFQESDGIKAFKKAWNAKYKDAEGVKTKHKKKRREIGSGKYEDYLEEQFMRQLLNEHFPGWSLYTSSHPIVIGDRLVLFLGELEIIDIEKFRFLTANGIPPECASYTRRFPAAGGGMFHFSKATGNCIHESNPHKKAVTEGLKYAINRLTGLGNDTYRKEELSVGLKTDEIIDLVSFVKNSKMTEANKILATKKIFEDISSDIVEEFKNYIRQKEKEDEEEREKGKKEEKEEGEEEK
ncbi:hypothetical protein KC678_04085 [Candidatus Dojkabacteria bacterium]|uniref:Uncharacterized protein n=1 Tax=Candidatus Dojkabacteria bacterium TaxID=2099670 RepID=A0A955RGQ0_9BACT|nr:hypothetical protein [Candidatus Dojkabacteria bacterium]